MTSEATSEPPVSAPDLARFLQDWTTLWQQELLAQTSDPETAEMWRAAMALWTHTLWPPPPVPRPPAGLRDGREAAGPLRDGAAPPGAQAGNVAFDARDAAIERLARRVDALEARLAGLEPARARPRRGA